LAPANFAIAMVLMGLISLLLGTWEHRRNMPSLRGEYADMPRSQTAILAILISVLGGLALVAVIFPQ
jgi:hypothetical protein